MSPGSMPSMRAAGRRAGCLEVCCPQTVRGLSRNQARDASWLVGSSGLDIVGSRPGSYSQGTAGHVVPSVFWHARLAMSCSSS